MGRDDILHQQEWSLLKRGKKAKVSIKFLFIIVLFHFKTELQHIR